LRLKSVLFLLTWCLSVSRPSLCQSAEQQKGSLHGTVNVVLANANGIVVLTDSMLTDQNHHQLQEPGQKLFVLDDSSVCAIAGLYQGAGAFKELNVSTRSKIYAFANSLKKSKKPLTLEEKLNALVFLFDSVIDTMANANDLEHVPFPDPRIELTVAGYDLDGVGKVLKATVFIEHRRFQGYDTLASYEPIIFASDRLAHQTSGLNKEVEAILTNPTATVADPVLNKYLLASTQRGGTLSLDEMNQLASRLARVAASAHPEVGGDDQVALLRKDSPPEIHQRKFEDPPPSPVDVYSEMTFTTTSASLPDVAERLKAYRPTITGRRHVASLYIESSVNGYWIPMDGKLFIGDTFEGCTFYYDGGETQIDQTDNVYDSDLLLGPHADLGERIVQHLLADFKWVNVGRTDMPLDPPPGYQLKKATDVPQQPKSPPAIVLRANFPLFTDQAATQRAPDITGVTLKVYGSMPGQTSLENFPTTKLHYYKPGMKVTWEWDSSKIWRYSMWYKDPKTHTVKLAFGGSMAFVGRSLKENQPK
jgi:20S proteasome alpha/beta subunit